MAAFSLHLIRPVLLLWRPAAFAAAAPAGSLAALYARRSDAHIVGALGSA
jgi:hypothetical protein